MTLWRHRGRAPQRLCGVGFGSEGFDVSEPCHRQEDSFDPAVAWMVAGIAEDEPLGDSGLGTHNACVRGDIVYLPTANGGAVWSVNSIAYCGARSHNNLGLRAAARYRAAAHCREGRLAGCRLRRETHQLSVASGQHTE